MPARYHADGDINLFQGIRTNQPKTQDPKKSKDTYQHNSKNTTIGIFGLTCFLFFINKLWK